MKKILPLIFILFSLNIYANMPKSWIVMDNQFQGLLDQKSSLGFNILNSNEKVLLLEADSEKIPQLTHAIHSKFHRCGGFSVHENKADALNIFQEVNRLEKGNFNYLFNYEITEQDRVDQYLEDIQESKIKGMIQTLSNYNNRYYQSDTGVQAAQYIHNHWNQLTGHRKDIKIEYFNHSRWNQPSVVLTFTGSQSPNEIIVIGGHLDSIAGFWNRQHARAPGADDNASGIATLTETIRVLAQNNYVPKKTIQFIGYAAEEVGLLGSDEIARHYKQQGKNVVGVVQFDMTNYQNGHQEISLMTDYTDQSQNRFMGQLIDTYVHVPWGNSRCGYGCSDHASWNKQGFSASMPFETEMDLRNRKIHTSEDTLANLRGNAHHALKFSKLALAFAVEMAK